MRCKGMKLNKERKLKNDGKMIKHCAVHGAVTDVYVKMRKNKPQVRCAICERAKARARNKAT